MYFTFEVISLILLN